MEYVCVHKCFVRLIRLGFNVKDHSLKRRYLAVLLTVHKRFTFDPCVVIYMILYRMTALIGVISSKEQCAFTIGVSNLTPFLGQEADPR